MEGQSYILHRNDTNKLHGVHKDHNNNQIEPSVLRYISCRTDLDLGFLIAFLYCNASCGNFKLEYVRTEHCSTLINPLL